jgi:hypothetical protein
VTDFAKLILDADTTGLKQGEKALKDLGKQSKVAADDVDSSAYKMGESIGKLAKVGFLALGAAATAAAGALFLAGRRALNTADEMMKTSQALNMNVESFQRAAYAARTVGIESEKLGDIYKDVNDKMGDFLATGGGELKDFFENIAPKVGITADAFRGLNGADALQLYVTSLEKAGVNTQEMTFYMEALANDASRLAPILGDNGARFKSLGDEAERLGIIIDERTGKAAQEFQVNMVRLGGIMDGITMKVMADLLPQLISLQSWLIKNQDTILGVARSFGTLISYIGKAADAYRRFKLEQGLRESQAMQVGIFRTDQDIAKARQDELRYRQALDDMDRPARGPHARAFGTAGLEELTRKSDMARVGMGALSAQALGAGTSLGKGLGGGARAANDNIKPLQNTMESAMETLRKFKQDMTASGLFSSQTVTSDATRQIRADDGPVYQDMGKLNASLTILYDSTEEMRKKAAETASQVGDSFRQMATDSLNALDRLASAIQSGNFLSILSGVLNIGLQFGGMGAFGSTVANRINAPGFGGVNSINNSTLASLRGRANGGNVSAGQSYLVGENRPEMFVPDTNGRIIPQVGGGATRVLVEASPFFDVRVDGRIQTAAPAIADAGANVAQTRMGRSATRRVA